MFLGFNSLLSQQAAGNLTQERLKINNKIQNDSPKFSIVGVISDISVASDFTTHLLHFRLRLDSFMFFQ
jgi:hypothetical protein